MYVFFDTETTGLPRRYNAAPEELDNWPRVVQMAWLAYDRKGKNISKNNFIIKPDGFTIPDDVARIHGISTAIAEKKGVPLKNALREFSKESKNASVLVAHNINFDFPILKAEFLRAQIDENLFALEKVCTMRSTVNYCKLPGWNGGYKYPKLSELYRHLFNKNIKSAHNALHDAKATADCFFELRKRNVI